MEIKVYKQDYDYSYTLGAFPTIELLRHKKEYVLKILIHSSFKNDDVLKEIHSLISQDKIEYNDNLINKLSDKENVYIIGVFH